jgi:hypothetical protein
VSLREHLIHRCHPRFHVLVNVTMEHPCADSVGDHVGSYKLGRQERKDVEAGADAEDLATDATFC